MAEKNWKIFEQNVVDYINKNLKIKGISAIAKGSSDSTSSDVRIEKNGHFLFNIECKLSPAQSGQFVVHNDATKQEFVLSNDNKYQTLADLSIIQHMNNNYRYYSQSPKGNSSNIDIDLICDESLMFQRIRLQIESKSKFIASSKFNSNFSSSNPLYFFSTQNLDRWFDVSGKYRTKQSGTGSLASIHLSVVRKYFHKYDIVIENDGSKERSYIRDPKNKLESRIDINDLSLFLSDANTEGLREIRKRAATKNANVIFSLELINRPDKNENIELLRTYINSI